MRVRKATTADFCKLKALKSEFYLWECKSDSRVDPDYVKRGLGSRLARNLRQKNTAFFIAEEKGEILGYAGAEIEKNLAFVRFRKRGHLFNLYVRPKYQGKGIGKALAREAMKWFKKRGLQDLRIMVYSHNRKAHEFYKRFGFKDYIMEMKR